MTLTYKTQSIYPGSKPSWFRHTFKYIHLFVGQRPCMKISKLPKIMKLEPSPNLSMQKIQLTLSNKIKKEIRKKGCLITQSSPTKGERWI